VTARDGLPRTPSTEALFRALVENGDEFTYLLDCDDLDGPALYVSPQAERVVGSSADEIAARGRHFSERVDPRDRARVARAARLTARTGERFDEEYRVVGADGAVRWIRDRGTVLPAGQRHGRLWLGRAIDITARRETQEQASIEEELHRQLIQQLPGVVFRLSSDGLQPRVTYVSSQVERLVGYAAPDWLEDTNLWWRIVHPDDIDAANADWAYAVATETPFRSEHRLRHADGTWVWVREETHPIRDAGGKLIGWQGLTTDITEAKLAEEARQASEARYQALVEQLPAVVYVDSHDGRPRSIYVSPNSEAILGHPAEGYRDDTTLWPRTMHPDDRDRVLEAWREAVRTEQPFHTVYRFVRPDGEPVWVRDTSILIRDEKGDPLYWQGVILDVSAQVRAEEQLLDQQARYRALVEGIPAVIYEMDPDDERRTLYVSPQIEQLLGYTRQEWLDQPDIWIELLHPDDREVELAAHDLHNETGEPWRREYRLIAADGAVVWVRDQAVLVRDEHARPHLWQGVLLDITAQKEAEEQLRTANDELEFRVIARTSQLEEANELMSLEIGERRRAEQQLRIAEERYRRLVEDLPAVVYIWQVRDAPDGTDHAYVSPQIEQLLGFTPHEWLDGWGVWGSRLHPHDRERVLEAADRIRRTGGPFQLEYRYLAKDGRIVWVLDQATLFLRDDAGLPMLYQGVMMDITARKEAERKAAEAEQRFRELAEASPVSTWGFDVSHDTQPPTVTLDYVGPQVAEVLGYPVASWIDDPQRWYDMVHPDDRARLQQLSAVTWVSGGPWAVDFRMIAADGRVVWMHDRGRCVGRDELGRPTRFVGVVMEVTSERETELRIRADETALRSLLEGMPAVTWTELSDPTTGWRRFAYISPQTVELFGYEADELLAEPGHFERMVHPDDLPRVLARIDEAESTGEPWVDEFRARHRDGSWRWFHAAARRITPDDVQPGVWQGVTVDITEQRGEGRGGSAVRPAKTVVIDDVEAIVTRPAGEGRYSG